MAQFKVNVPQSGHKQDVIVAAGIGISTNQVQILIDTNNVASKEQLLLAIQYAVMRITQSTWPNVS